MPQKFKNKKNKAHVKNVSSHNKVNFDVKCIK